MSDQFPVPTARHPASIEHVDPFADANFRNGIEACRRTGRFMIVISFVEGTTLHQEQLIQNFPNGDFVRAANLLKNLTDQLEKQNGSPTVALAGGATTPAAAAQMAMSAGNGAPGQQPAISRALPPAPDAEPPEPATPENAAQPPQGGDSDVPKPLSPVVDATNPNPGG